MGQILLRRGIAWFQNDRKALAVSGRGITRRPEVQQLYLAVLSDENVVRRDVPVDDALLVDSLQRSQNGQNEFYGFLVGQLPAVFCQILFQRHAVQIFHDNVRRQILRKAVQYPHDTGHVLKFCQPLCFIQKLLQTGHKLRVTFTIVNCDGEIAWNTGGILTGHIFLDGNFLHELVIPRDISDAEATEANGATNGIPVMQQAARFDMIGLFCGRSFYVAAKWAHRIVCRVCLHTSHASSLLHIGHSFCGFSPKCASTLTPTSESM